MTYFNETYGQAYHSKHGAVKESRLVFLQNSGVAGRLQAGLATNLLEIGFGLGLNFLLTAQLACSKGTILRYSAFENQLIDASTFCALGYGKVLQADDLAVELAQLLENTTGFETLSGTFQGVVQLNINTGDASAATGIEKNGFHAVYLDAFSPDVNPELWTAVFLQSLFESLIPGGKLVTYCVKGSFRRTLQAIGFEVFKTPGPPGKREVLTAVRPVDALV